MKKQLTNIPKNINNTAASMSDNYQVPDIYNGFFFLPGVINGRKQKNWALR